MRNQMILTERCIIRNFRESDMEVFISYRNNSDWMKYQGFKCLSKAEYKKALLRPAYMDDGMQLAVADRVTDALMGDLYIRREKDAYWVGYTIHPDYERKGLMLEAFIGLINHLKEVGDRSKVLAGALPENTRSKNLLEKAGFDYSYFDKESREEIYLLEF